MYGYTVHVKRFSCRGESPPPDLILSGSPFRRRDGLSLAQRIPCPACYHHAMPEDGPLALDDRIVWYKNGNIHRDDGPAIEFKDGRKLWALNGQEVTEQEVAAHRQAREHAARERSDKLWQSHVDEIGYMNRILAI